MWLGTLKKPMIKGLIIFLFLKQGRKIQHLICLDVIESTTCMVMIAQMQAGWTSS